MLAKRGNTSRAYQGSTNRSWFLEENQIRKGTVLGGLENTAATYAESFGFRSELENRSNSGPAVAEGADTT